MKDRSVFLDSELEEEVVPNPAALIESLRSFGYRPSTAVADLIDNSVTAGATRVDVQFEWSGPDSFVAVHDDGAGMHQTGLRDAMRAGSSNPLAQRQSTDLGRFGLGLKTASFSQARSLTVMSKAAGGVSIRRWDLDHVGRTNRWSLLKSPSPEAASVSSYLDNLSSGTSVVWSRLDRIVDDRPASEARARQSFFAVVSDVKQHLEMVFHRIMTEDGLTITVNDQPCVPWDPFLQDHPHTERLPNEDRELTVPSGERQSLRIQPFVLPHRSALTPEQARTAAGPKGWNLQQGFYLYRARRLIVAGDWFDTGMKPEEHHKLARIEVQITQDMDPLWNLDVRKSRGRPPSYLRHEFRRIARATREKAEAVYRYRGKRSTGQTPRKRQKPVWFVESAGKTVRYSINRDHDMVRHFLDAQTPANRRNAKGLLSLIEGNLPVAHILSTGFEDEEKLTFDIEELGLELTELIRELYCGLRSDGYSDEAAKKTLMSNQPFERFGAAIEAIAESGCS